MKPGAKSIRLPVRYFSMHNSGVEDVLESNTRYTHAVWELPVAETALVLVDFWTTHILESHLRRCEEVIRRNVVPLLPAARGAGITVIYGPGFNIAKKYPGWERYAEVAEMDPPKPEPPDWPPESFRKREGEYSRFARPFFAQQVRAKADELFRIRRIPDAVEPEPEDHVIASGPQLHRLLRDKKILHLLYLGFATNDCVLHKDYGVRAMGGRGYNIILLRDCTMGIENAASLATFGDTRGAMHYIELHHASSTGKAVIRGCSGE
jgi:nicotinamidase-related amidase